MTTKTMKAITATGYGSPEVFQFTSTATRPEPKRDEVLVKVMVSSATTADTMMRTGKPYIGRLFTGVTKPKYAIPGTGFAGIVEEVGSEVTSFKVGDRVFGESKLGFSANAEYLSIPQTGVMLHMPDSMDFSEAASFADGHLTSYNFLRAIAQVKPGQKILINGASGSLGTAAIQIAKYFGAEVTAVCSGKNIGLVKSLGADHVVNYQEVDFTTSSQQYDFIYDTVGKSSFKACKSILTSSGTYLSPVLGFGLLMDMLKTSFSGSQKAKFEATGANSAEVLRPMLQEVLTIFQGGKLKTVIDRQFPLEKLADAHRYIDSGRKRGNVIIVHA